MALRAEYVLSVRGRTGLKKYKMRGLRTYSGMIERVRYILEMLLDF